MESPVRIVKACSPWSMLRRRSNATVRFSFVPMRLLAGSRLTDATAQRFEITFLWPAGETVVVDFAHDAGVGAGPALRPVSVTWRLRFVSALTAGQVSEWELAYAGPIFYIAASASDTPRTPSLAVAWAGPRLRARDCCLCVWMPPWEIMMG
jgi:hypothetical protein